MLDRLPLELVQHIVFLTLPSSSSFTKYRERQTPLLALCLTSRALRRLAQPVLFESVNLEDKEAVDSFLEVVEANEVLGKCTRALRIEYCYDDERDAEDLDTSRYSRACSNIVDITLLHQLVEMPAFESFPNLRRLNISHGRVCASAFFCLPTLEQLSLVCADFSAVDVFQRPESTLSLPSLQALHIQCTESGQLALDCLDSLQPQLVAFSCDIVDLVSADNAPTPKLRRQMLYDFNVGTASVDLRRSGTADLRNLRLNPFAGEPEIYNQLWTIEVLQRTLLEALITVIHELQDPSALSALSTIYFPSAFNGFPFDLLDSTSYSDPFTRIKRLCTSRNIELIFEDLSHPHYDSFISPEFVRRCKAAKAKEAADQIAKGAKE